VSVGAKSMLCLKLGTVVEMHVVQHSLNCGTNPKLHHLDTEHIGTQ
jgi:hypothetical protein